MQIKQVERVDAQTVEHPCPRLRFKHDDAVNSEL